MTRKPKAPTPLELELDRLLEELKNEKPNTEEYNGIAEQLIKLYKLKEVDNTAAAKKSLSADTMLIVAANLLGMGIVVGFESIGIVRSKALGMLLKLTPR